MANAQQFRPIRFEVNGSVVNMLISIEDLRVLLGLPAYDLIAPFRPPVQMVEPSTNIDDLDHEELTFIPKWVLLILEYILIHSQSSAKITGSR